MFVRYINMMLGYNKFTKLKYTFIINDEARNNTTKMLYDCSIEMFISWKFRW